MPDMPRFATSRPRDGREARRTAALARHQLFDEAYRLALALRGSEADAAQVCIAACQALVARRELPVRRLPLVTAVVLAARALPAAPGEDGMPELACLRGPAREVMALEAVCGLAGAELARVLGLGDDTLRRVRREARRAVLVANGLAPEDPADAALAS